MDWTLRSLIKCHGYWTALFCCTIVVWWTWFTLDPERSIGFVKAHNIRYFGIPALIFGMLWTMACVALVVAIYKESLFLLCPFSTMFLIEFGALLCRDIYLVASHHNMDETYLFNLSAPGRLYLSCILYVVPNIAFSLLALKHIFQDEKKIAGQDSDYFIS
ncbi:uncharacterized protein LOC134287412 [Aedes albopictus]|uniref:Secreted protein n=1 Tax=Aedes albopictus TaxID=7160 RepID=A0ABM1ZLC2_AEDAL